MERFTNSEWIVLSQIFRETSNPNDRELFQDLQAIVSIDAVEEFIKLKVEEFESERNKVL